LPLAILAALFIIAPFLAWYGTWFGRNLSDDTITQYLADQENPRHVQHALSQVESRIEGGDTEVKRWYPQIIKLAGSNALEVRQTVAWVMGQDNKTEEFHTALAQLLNDPAPIVRRNAALAITRFGDASGRAELIAALQPFNMAAPADGILKSSLASGSTVSVGTLLARIEQAGNHNTEVRSPLPGKIEKVFVGEGNPVISNQTLISIAPDERSILEALLALRFVGAREDAATIEAQTRNMSAKIKEQAALTVKTIQSRVVNIK
jgi:acetyl/propionyl-CoA carboxylase alpha subunit